MSSLKDIGRRLPLELQCSLHQGQQGDIGQSVRGTIKPIDYIYPTLSGQKGVYPTSDDQKEVHARRMAEKGVHSHVLPTTSCCMRGWKWSRRGAYVFALASGGGNDAATAIVTVVVELRGHVSPTNYHVAQKGGGDILAPSCAVVPSALV